MSITYKIWIDVSGLFDDQARYYEELAKDIKGAIEARSRGDHVFEVRLIREEEKITDLLADEPINTLPKRIIFVSNLMLHTARRIRLDRRYKGIEVVVLTGLVPDGEVAIIPKLLLVSREDLGRLATY